MSHLILEAWVCYSVIHSKSLYLHPFSVNVYCNDSLVWLEFFGFCDTIYIGASPVLLPIILLSSVIKDLAAYDHQDYLFDASQYF